MAPFELKPNDDPIVNHFRTALLHQQWRRPSNVVFDAQMINPDVAVEDFSMVLPLIADFVTGLGFTGHLTSWLAIPRPEALGVLAGALAVDLVNMVAMLNWSDAEQQAIRFLQLFPENESCRYYTNLGALETNAPFANGREYECGSPLWRGWNPMRELDSSDTSIVVVSEKRLGILWVQDHD
jgi:hypothetical protein